MPVDTLAGQSAQNMLNGIDYSALIGGPLQAAITAQAMAAKSTWEFIQAVGLQQDKDGNKSAVNVAFLYQKDGQMVKLIVPILTIVPIPCIMIDEVDIQFKANINASASTTTEESKSEQVAGELEAEGKIGWGPFSLSAKMKASYSSKKDSKATQDSRYSVEYTQDVHVHASQAGVPAGLSTILNILASAATEASPKGDFMMAPPYAKLRVGDPSRIAVDFLVKDSNGKRLANKDITLVPKSAQADECVKLLQVMKSPNGSVIPWDATTKKITLKTLDDGTISILLTINPAVKPEEVTKDPVVLVVEAESAEYPKLPLDVSVEGGTKT